jgi:alkylation response protein AidB-like acyl-CoA dehydrogenase
MMSTRSTLDFLLNDWLDVCALTTRPRFADHSAETFTAVLDVSERIANEKFAPFNRLVDTEEPRFDGTRVILPQATLDATRAYAEAGLRSAGHDYEMGGMQLPYVIEAAFRSFFLQASIAIDGYTMLTAAGASLIVANGTQQQVDAFARPELDGRFMGTMCLSEPQAGSSLSDIETQAVPDGNSYGEDELGPRYRLKGNKMWISAGEHDLAQNIVHLVLAKIRGPDGKTVPGAKGISLFIVPKLLLDANGQLTGERNDVALAGLNHKLGYRGTVNTLLNFGEGKFPVRAPGGLDGKGAGAIAYLVGKPGEGLQRMFHMMNEARIQVGLGATMLGCAGYQASLDYAQTRLQGRPSGPAGKDPTSPQRPIIEHADVRRMLLAQKAYCEGALALMLYCARLVDEKATGDAASASDAAMLLELLTPIAKSWPSEWCLEANSLAIQIHGGYGYTRDFPVEQYWRDNRLNMIHEGAHGIHSQDLLGRKVRMEDGRALAVLGQRISETIRRSSGHDALVAEADVLAAVFASLKAATAAAWQGGDREVALRNSMPYMQAFGHVVIAWLWLDIASAAAERTGQSDSAFLNGKMHAARYFFHYELPRVDAWLKPVFEQDDTFSQMDAAWL